MGTSIRRTTIWLVLAALSIAAAAWMAAGVSADAGAQPTGGSVKVIKPASTQGTFIFDISCLPSGLSYAPEFPTDFNGANWESANEIPDGDDCTVTETFPNGDADAWVVEHKVEGNDPGTGQFQPGPTGVVPIDAPSTNTIRYKNDPKPTEPEPESGSLKIIKQPTPGNADGPWLFTWVCDDKAGTTGTAVYPGDFAPGKEFDVPGDIALGTDCTVTETFPNNDAASWDTSYQIEAGPFKAGTVAVVPINNSKGTNTVKFKNDFIEPEPEIAAITVVKKFEGPNNWRFGFALACDGFAETFVLGGGQSASFKVPLSVPGPTLVTENRNGAPHQQCVVAEELLVGDWTVNVSVTGGDKYKTTPTGATGAGAAFAVYPGDAVTVTFENIPGYTAQKPSGIPPEIANEQ